MNQVETRLGVPEIYGKSCHEDFVIDDRVLHEPSESPGMREASAVLCVTRWESS